MVITGSMITVAMGTVVGKLAVGRDTFRPPGVGVGVAEVVRTRVTTTTLLGHPAAEKVMFWVYVPAAKPSVCGVKVVEVPLAPLVGWALNQGEVSDWSRRTV